MGKKKKLAKGRLDKYYHLAKEQGFRSRAAYKLVQLEKKYQFLAKSNAVLDLCAAPGGWMQVAHKTVPHGTPIVGIDLTPIKPIPGCVGIVGDITTQKARNDIKKELKGRQCDVVLHDGAPNVGLAWAQDAFAQNELVLHSLRLATDTLKEGGTFVTKVFRSKDYNSLLWIFNQLFTRVEATKPAASRNTSAEIFVVCREFLAPKKIDPKLLDIRYAFKEYEEKTKLPSIFSKDHSKKLPRIGYDDSNPTQFKKVEAKEFVTTNEAVRLLGEYNEISFEGEESQVIKQMKPTSGEILALCSDLRVLSKGDFRVLLRWRDAINREFEKIKKEKIKEEGEEEEGEENSDEENEEEEEKEITIEEMQDLELEKKIRAAHAQEKKDRKKKMEKKRNLQRKLDLKMILPGDSLEQQEIDLFSLRKIKNLDSVAEAEIPDFDLYEVEQEEAAEEDKKRHIAAVERAIDEDFESTAESRIDRMEEELDIWYAGDEARKSTVKIVTRKGKKVRVQADPELDIEMLESYKKLKEERTQTTDYIPIVSGEVAVDDDQDADANGAYDEYPMRVDSEGEEDNSGSESEDDVNDMEVVKKKYKESVKDNDLIRKGDSDELSHKSRVWFNQSIFEGIEEEEEETQLELLLKQNKRKKGGKQEEVQSDSEEEEPKPKKLKQLNKKTEAAKNRKKEEKQKRKEGGSEEKEGFEEVPMGHTSQTFDDEDADSDVDPEDQERALMLATMIKRDKKLKDQLVDGLYNRYAWDDKIEDLPVWFQSEEKPHNTPTEPITKEVAKEIKDKLKELSARPIKKVAEAKARKKMKMTQKMEKAKAKAEVIASNSDLSNAEKSKAITTLYRKNMKSMEKKKNFNYIVASKGRGATGKPVGSGKGPTRVVDTRLKKDKRGMAAAKRKGGGKGKGKK